MPVRSLEVVADLDHVGGWQPRYSKRNGVKYLEETMARVETDRRSAVARANAWAVGDVKTLRDLTRNDDFYTTLLPRNWPYLSAKEANEVVADAQRQLGNSIYYATLRNNVTFVAIPIHLLFREGDLLADLRLNGLSVEEPN